MPYFSIRNLNQIDSWRDDKRRRQEFKHFNGNCKYCRSNDVGSFGIYKSLTLDEYCIPALPLKVLDRRNKDQAILRLREYVNQFSEITVVSQAWLWKTKDVLIAAVERNTTKFEFTPISSTGAPSDLLRGIGVFLADLIDLSDRVVDADSSDTIFDLYEKSIIIVAENVDEYFQSIGVIR